MALPISSHQHYSNVLLPPSLRGRLLFKIQTYLAANSRNTTSGLDGNPSQNPNSNPKRSSTRIKKSKGANNKEKDPSEIFPMIIPKKPKHAPRSEAAAVEDFLRDSLEQTFASIREQNPEILRDRESIMKERIDDDIGSDDSSDDDDADDSGNGEKGMVVEEVDPYWPLDADVGWGIRASEYFEQYPIKNATGEDGVEIDWEGEIDNGLVKEINCLEWESFAFRPRPLIVLVFERYNRASENWKVLKELQKAAEVYWKAKDRLPPRVAEFVNVRNQLEVLEDRLDSMLGSKAAIEKERATL